MSADTEQIKTEDVIINASLNGLRGGILVIIFLLINVMISAQPVIMATVLNIVATGLLKVTQCSLLIYSIVLHFQETKTVVLTMSAVTVQIKDDKVITNAYLNRTRCVLHCGILSTILLSINVITDIPMLMSMEWTTATIAGAILLPDICWRYYNLTTQCIILACIWSLQVVIALSISTQPVIVVTVLNGVVTGLLKVTQCSLKHILEPK